MENRGVVWPDGKQIMVICIPTAGADDPGRTPDTDALILAMDDERQLLRARVAELESVTGVAALVVLDWERDAKLDADNMRDLSRMLVASAVSPGSRACRPTEAAARAACSEQIAAKREEIDADSARVGADSTDDAPQVDGADVGE